MNDNGYTGAICPCVFILSFLQVGGFIMNYNQFGFWIYNIVSIDEIEPHVRVVRNKRVKYYKIVFNGILSPEIIAGINKHHAKILLRSDMSYEMQFRTSACWPNQFEEAREQSIYIHAISLRFNKDTHMYALLGGTICSDIDNKKVYPFIEPAIDAIKTNDSRELDSIISSAKECLNNAELSELIFCVDMFIDMDLIEPEVKAIWLRFIAEYDLRKKYRNNSDLSL